LAELKGDEEPVHLSRLYERIAFDRSEAGLSLNATFHATVRRTIQDSKFTRPSGRKGFWELVPPAEIDVD